jgi:hypothetical protein
VGQPVDEQDKLHWFLRGLGTPFEKFSTEVRATKPPSVFRDLLIQAESHELFLSLHTPAAPPVAFNSSTNQYQSSTARGRGGRFNRGSDGRGRGRRTPHCQLCRTAGHYENSCPNLASYASKQSPPTDSELATAFHAQCHVNTGGPDWYVDTGATDHMTSSPINFNKPTNYMGDAKVTFRNGKTLPVLTLVTLPSLIRFTLMMS